MQYGLFSRVFLKTLTIGYLIRMVERIVQSFLSSWQIYKCLVYYCGDYLHSVTVIRRTKLQSIFMLL